MNWKDITNRAVWTAIQAAVGIIVAAFASGQPVNSSLVWKAVAIGVAAAVSVVKNIVVQKRSGTP